MALLMMVSCSEEAPSSGEELPTEPLRICTYYHYVLCEESARCAAAKGIPKTDSERSTYTSECYEKRTRVEPCPQVKGATTELAECLERLRSSSCDDYQQRPDSDPAPDLPLPAPCFTLLR